MTDETVTTTTEAPAMTPEERAAKEAELRAIAAETQAKKVAVAQEREADPKTGHAFVTKSIKDPRAEETPEEVWARDPAEAAARTPGGGQLPGVQLPVGQPPSLSASTMAEQQAGREALAKYKEGREAAKQPVEELPPDPDALPRNPNSLPDLPRLPDHDAEDASFVMENATLSPAGQASSTVKSKKKK